MSKHKLFDIGFLVSGLIVQIVAYIWNPVINGSEWPHPLSLISGLLGITAVILCSQGKLVMFAFGVLQILTYSLLCLWQNLYSGIAINLFYLSCQCYGIWNWHRRIKGASLETNDAVPAIKLSKSTLTIIVTTSIILSTIVGYLLSIYTNDTQPYLDAYTTVPTIAAEIMMIMAIREHWYFWFVTDIIFVVLWMRAADPCMSMLYLFRCINCIYGWYKWSK